MDLLTTIFAVSPLLLIIAIVLPLLVAEMGIHALPVILNPETYIELIKDAVNNISQLNIEEIIEFLKEAIQVHIEMQ